MTYKDLLQTRVIPLLVSKYDNVGTGFTIITPGYTKNIISVQQIPGGYKSFAYYQKINMVTETPTLYSEAVFTTYFKNFVKDYGNIDLDDTAILNTEISPRQLAFVLSVVIKFVTCCTKFFGYIGTNTYIPIFSYCVLTPTAESLPDADNNEIYTTDFNMLEDLLNGLMLKPVYDETYTESNQVVRQTFKMSCTCSSCSSSCSSSSCSSSSSSSAFIAYFNLN